MCSVGAIARELRHYLSVSHTPTHFPQSNAIYTNGCKPLVVSNGLEAMLSDLIDS